MSKDNKEKRESKFKEKLPVSVKPLSILFFCGAVVSVILRAIQMAKHIDPETGFYTGGNAVKVILYGVLALSALVFCGVSYLSLDCAKLSFHNNENKTVGTVSAIMGVAFFIDSFSSFGGSFSSLGSASGNYTSLMSSGAAPMLLQAVFGFFSGVFFFILAKDMLKGTAAASKRKFLATMPVWWAGARLIHRFLRQISFVEVSDLLLELLMIGTMLFFFMAMAQVVSGVYSDGFRWRIFGLGYTASLLALTTSVPRLVFSFINSGFINAQHPFYLCDLVFALFAVTLILCHKPQEPESEAVTENETAV